MVNFCDGNIIRIGNNTYPIPDYVKRTYSHSFCIVNGHCYINGYKVTKDGKFKRTIPAIFYHIFA